LLLVGCASGSVRQSRTGALGAFADCHTFTVQTSGPGEAPLKLALSQSFAQALAGAAQLEPAAGDDGRAFRLELKIVDLREPAAPASVADRLVFGARNLLGLAGDDGSKAGYLAVEGTLRAPGGAAVPSAGYVSWSAEGTPLALSSIAGQQAGRALGEQIARRRHDYVERRAADERLFLTPTPLTLEPGEFVISDDELILLRLGVGLSRRLQLDLWVGGFPVPAAGGGALAGHGIIAAGGAGAVVVGFFDVGLKVRLLDETASRPGVAFSYDLLDLFGAAVGGGGVALFGAGAAGAGFVAVGGANLQFNLFSLVASRHFGHTQVLAGGYLLDNHHFLSQTAGFAAACGAGGVGEPGADGKVEPCAGGSTRIERLPIHAQPFFGVEQVLGEHSALAAELLPRARLRDTVGTTGVRWLIGSSSARGPLALDRIRLRLDLAAVWLYLPPSSRKASARGAVLPLPWLGVGLYFL
jgi:hypothetical protein